MFDRTYTIVLPGGAGPQVVQVPDVILPGGAPQLEMEAWGGGLEGSNAFIFEDNVQLPDAQGRVSRAGKMDCLMVVPRAGVGCIRIPGDLQEMLTVFFDSANAAIQAVTIRIRECYK